MAQPTFDDVKLQFDSIVGDFRTNKTTWEKSRFDLDVLLKGPDFDLNDEERKDLIDRAVGRYNVDAMTQGNTGGILDIAGSFVPKSVDYVSAVIDESPKQLSNFDTQFAKSVYGIAQSYYEDDPDPRYLAQRTYGGVPKVSPDLAQQGVNDALQRLPSAVGGGTDPLPFAEERNAATEYLKGLATRAGDAFMSGAESLIDLSYGALPENYDEYLGGAAPKYATREEVEARVKDNIRRSVENTQKAISERLAEKIAELEEDPLPPAYTAFGKGFASLGESIVSMFPALLATVPGARYPSMYLSNDVAAQMVASEARQDFLQDELWLEMSKNMTDLEKQNALSEILPIVSFEAKTMRKGFSDAAAADLAAMFPTGSIKVALSLDVAGGGVSEMFDTDIVGVAARRALKYYADKNNLPISSDPRINLVNRYDYIRANPEKALESLKTGMVMSGIISTPSSLIDAYRIKRAKTKGKNQNANPAQIEALTNTVLQKLQTIDPKNQKQVEDTVAYITRINPLGVNVVEELNTLVEQGGTLSDTQKELLKLYNKLPAFLDAPVEEGPTTAAEDVLATGPANMSEYYKTFQDSLTDVTRSESPNNYGNPSTDAQARQRGAELAAADGPEDTSGLLPTPDTIIPPLPQPESDLNLTEPIGPELKPLDDSAIVVRESKRKRKLSPGQALKKAQKKGFQTEEDRNIAEVMEEFYNDLGSQRFPERFNETGDLDSLESSRENSEEIAIDRAIRAEDQFRAAQEDQERRLNDQLSVLPKDSELRKKLEDIKKQRREAQKQTDAILKADEQIEQRDFNANQKQLRKEALAREALANQQKIVEIEDTMRGLEEAAEKAKKSQSTIKEQDRVFDQDILADLDQRIAEQQEQGAITGRERARYDSIAGELSEAPPLPDKPKMSRGEFEGIINTYNKNENDLRNLVAKAESGQTLSVDEVAELQNIAREQVSLLEQALQAEVEGETTLEAQARQESFLQQEQKSRERVSNIVQELVQEEQDVIAESIQEASRDTTASELETLDSVINLLRPIGERLGEAQDAAAQTERVQRIFDTENTTRSEVGNGLTINPETPRGAQILKERELEVLKDVLEQEYPGATKVDMVVSEAEAAALLPEGVSAEGQEGVMYSDSEGIKIVLIGQNIENKQVFDGTPADSRQALLTNAIRDGVRIYFHESLGHAGLRQAFGNNEAALQDFFGRIYDSNRQDEINSWGTERYGADAWETMPSAEKAEEWLVQNFVEEGVRPSGILDSLRLFFGADKESSDPAIRQLVNNIHDSLRQGRKPTIVRSAVGAQTTVAEEPPVEEVSVPTEQQSVPNEGASVEQDTPSVTPPVTPSDTSLDSVFRSAYEKGITPPSKSMIRTRKKRFFIRYPFLRGVDLNEMDVNLIQGKIKAAQDEIDSIMNPVNLEMINNPATRRARKLTAAQRNKVRGLLTDIQTMQEILGSAQVAPVAQTDQAAPEVTPEAAPVQEPVPDPDLKVGDTIRFQGQDVVVEGFEDGQNDEVVPVVRDPETGDIRPVPRSMREDLESTSPDVQPIAEETPEEAAQSGSAVRMSGGRQFSEKGPEETQEVVGYYRNSSGRLPKVQTLQSLGIDKKVADDVIDKGAVVIRWDRLKAGEEQFGQELWGGQSFPLLDLMQQNGIAGASANGALGAIVNSAVENKTPYVIVESMDESGVDGNPATLPAYVNMLEERIADLDPADQEQVMREINTRFSDQVASAIFQTALDKPVNAQRMNVRSPFRLDKPIDEKTLFAGLIKKLKDNNVEKKTLIDAVTKARESDFAKSLQGEPTAKADQLFDALTKDYSLGGLLSPTESNAMQYLIDTRIADMNRAAEVGRKAQSNLQPLVDVSPKENSTVEEMMSSLNDAVTLLDEATFGDRAGAVLKLVPQTLADKLGLPSVTSLKKEIQERTDLPEGGAIQLIQLPFPKNEKGFDFSEGQPNLKKAQEAAKKRIITTGSELNIPSHPAYTHFMRGKFLGRFDKVLPKDTLMTDKERARGNAATPKYSDKLVSDPTSQNIVRSNVGGTGALVSPTQELLVDYTNNKNWTESTNKTNRRAFNKHLRLSQNTQVLPSVFELNQNELDNSRIFSIGPTDNLEQKTSAGKETVRPAVRVAVVKDTPQSLRVKGISTLERDSGSLPTVAGLLKAVDVLGEERQANPEVQLTAKDLIGEDNSLQFKELGYEKIGVEPLDTSGMVNSEKRALKRILEKQGLDLTTPVKDGSTMNIAGEDFYLPPVNVYQWTGDETNGTDPSTYYDNFVRNVGLGIRGPLKGRNGGTTRSSVAGQDGDGQSTQGVRQRPQEEQDTQRSATDQETRSEVSGTTGEGSDTSASVRFSSKRLSAKESAAQEFAKTTLVPNTVLRNMLGAYPEYMDGVVQHMTNLRNKWQAGQMKPRDVAKAYWITIASIGSAATKFENAQNYFDTTIPDAFASYNKNGVKMVRPEEFAAFWFTTPIGQRALDAIDQGRVDKDAFDDLVAKRQRAFGRFDMTKPDGRYFPKPLTAGTRRVQGIDPKTNKPKQQNVPITPFGATIPSPNLDGSRPGVMSDIDPTGDLFSESLGRPKEGAYGVRDMYEIAQRINQKPGDKAVLKEELGKLTGIGEFGKLPFISHFFGVGDSITMDARELNFWITGEVDTSRLTEAKKKGTATPEELQKLETLRKFKQNDELKRLLNQEILNRMQELQRQGVIPANLTVDDLGEVGHHWIWDASEGDVTTHEGTYLTMTRFSSARRRPLQNNPQGRTKDQQAARGALNALQTFFDTKTNMPEREFFEELKQAARGKMSAYVEAGRDLGNLFMKAKPIEQALIYQYLTDPNGSPTSIPNRQVGKTDLRQAAIDAKSRIEKIGEDLVRLGMLDPQVFENRRGQYLPRIYLKHLFSEEHQKILSSGGSLKTSDLGYLKKMKDIDALVRESVLGEIKSPGYLVSRVLMQSGQDIAKMDFLKALSRNQNWVLPESYVEISYGNEIENILNANPSLRRQLLNEGLPPAARQTAVRRVTPEYLASEARRLRDAVIPYKQGASKKLAEDLASVMEQKVAQARGNQDYDPLNYTKLPDSARYGDLRGAVVRNEIYDEFVGSPFANDQTKIEEAIGVITSLMKFNLTAANPVVWANNLRSNTAMMHFAGLPVHRNIQYRWKAFKEVLLNRSRYKAFKDQGLTLSTFAANELGKLETQLALSLSPADRKILSRPIRFSKPVLMGQSIWAFFYNKLGGLYQMMEVIDKLALGMYLEDHGPSTGIPLANGKKMSTAAAMREANKWLFDYSDVPDSIRRYRKSVLGAPFITWAYKATPQLLGMMKKPTGWLRAGTWYGLLHMVMASQEADLDDEEYDAYYASLPDWLAQRDYFSIPLPMKDENGMMVTEDYTMFAPHAMLMNLGTTAFFDAAGTVVPDEMLSDKARRFNLVDEAKALGFASHPLLESTMELIHNRDSFTGKPIYYDTDTTGDFNAKIYEHFTDNLYPQLIAPNGFTRKLIELSVDDPNIFGPSSVLDRQGNPTRTLGQQARRAFPLVPNQYPSDPRSNLGYRMADIQKAMKEEAKKYAANRRKYRGDKETLRKLTEEHREEMDRLRRLMREFPRAGDLPRLQEYAE